MGRIAREKKTIDVMLGMYCSGHHGSLPSLCPDCASLKDYALRRLDNCPFHEHKPACNGCCVHCYSAPMRERMRSVMRYSGPRMTLRHPWLALLHMLDVVGSPPCPNNKD